MPSDPDAFFADFKNVAFETIERMTRSGRHTSDIIGYLMTGDKAKEDVKATLPTYLSMFILAHSRRVMSKMVRHVNGYKDQRRTVYYSDTDSLVVNMETFNLLKDKYIGSKLGQLEDEFPKDIIVAARFLAPKTYCLMLARPVDVLVEGVRRYSLHYKVRCKGIPHRGDIFEARKYFLDKDGFNDSLKKVDEALTGPVHNLKDRYYVLHDRENPHEKYILPYFDIAAYDKLLSEKYLIVVHYGTILRGAVTNFSLTTRWAHRCIGQTSWWHQPDCPRIMVDKEGYEVTKCSGYAQGDGVVVTEDVPDFVMPTEEELLSFNSSAQVAANQEEFYGFDEFFM